MFSFVTIYGRHHCYRVMFFFFLSTCVSVYCAVEFRRIKFNMKYYNVYSVFTAYIMLFISDNCRLHVSQVVIRDKLIIS